MDVNKKLSQIKEAIYMAPVSKKQQQSVNKYIGENYDRVNLTIKKGTKQTLQDIAKNKGESINGYIKAAVSERYKADTGNDIEL